MQIGVAYSEPGQQIWLNIEVPDESTVKDAIERSGILKQFPHIDLSAQKVGVFGRLVKLDATLKAGDRVEIYRGIVADPETVPDVTWKKHKTQGSAYDPGLAKTGP